MSYRMRTAILLRATFLSLCCISLAACPPSETTRKPLRIGYSPLTLNAPLFVALNNNLFNGPTEATAFQSTNEMLAALVAGRIDLASAVTTESVLQTHSLQPGILKTVLYNAEPRTWA